MMKEADLNNVFSISLRLFTILKEEYNNYLSEDRKKFLEELDIFHFYKFVNSKDLPVFVNIGDTILLNKYYKVNFIEYLPLICMSSLCGNINPLKLGLIEKELNYLNEKYALGYKTINDKELDVATVVSKSLLDDISFPIIFIENDIDIFDYLAEEKGSKLAFLYKEISDSMKNNYNSKDYSQALDLIYDYLSNKVK